MNLWRRSLADRDSLAVSLLGLCAAWSSGQQARGRRASPPLLLVLLLVLFVPSSLLGYDSGRTEYKAQQPGKVHRIGILGGTISPQNSSVESLRQGLQELGYEEGRNLVIEYRAAGDAPERYPQLVADFVRLKMDVVVALSTPAALAAKEGTSTIPKVMLFVSDPVGWEWLPASRVPAAT